MLLGELGSSRHLWVIAETLIGNGNNANLYMFPTGILSGLLVLKSFHLHEVIPCSLAQRSTTPANTTRPVAIEPLILDYPLSQSTSSFPKKVYSANPWRLVLSATPLAPKNGVRSLPSFARNTSRVVCHHNPYSQAKKRNRNKWYWLLTKITVEQVSS
jgi:hypothetical protein